ncbi:hypothetical protein TeGR_g9851 [Tetraparma gracilis]|uniref:Tyrosine-protein kinase ephrin type A/B receptor-like domain-containing protein n=1 Tax=Tetraparma gracilis TaxID=2962635 RepID=A0ABQ6NAE6_9STRA|nr:hypothetical protein TeGR_g9851 [Tetraparma gracilis]
MSGHNSEDMITTDQFIRYFEDCIIAPAIWCVAGVARSWWRKAARSMPVPRSMSPELLGSAAVVLVGLVASVIVAMNAYFDEDVVTTSQYIWYIATFIVFPGTMYNKIAAEGEAKMPAGATVLIAEGTYAAGLSSSDSTLFHVVELHGSISCDEDGTGLNLHCVLDGSSSRRVMLIEGTSGEVLELRGLLFFAGAAEGVGGGLALDDASIVELVLCTFQSCQADFGGGVGVEGADTSLDLSGVVFQDNAAASLAADIYRTDGSISILDTCPGDASATPSGEPLDTWGTMLGSLRSYTCFYSCDAGHTNPTSGYLSLACEPCPTGSYSGAGQHSGSGSVECTECEAGKYSDTPASASCSLCGEGKFSADAGSSAALHDAESDCDVCDSGKYNGVPGSAQCEECPLGTFMPESASAADHDALDDCLVCLAGSFADETASTMCTTCPAGTYLTDDGVEPDDHDSVTSCTICPAGYFLADEGTDPLLHSSPAQCLVCGSGKYIEDDADDAQSHAECTNCAAGTYIEDDGALFSAHDSPDDCAACPFIDFAYQDEGRQASSPDGKLCGECDLGYGPSEDGIECEQCEYGEYSETVSFDMCKACPEGAISTDDREGCLAGVPCPIGFGSSPDGLGDCLECAVGRYSSVNDARLCDKCQPGKYLDAIGGLNEGACTLCPAGKSNSERARGEVCEPCRAGYYAPNTGFEVCGMCPVGEVAPDAGMTSCTTCQPGYFSNSDRTECERCQDGFYTERAGSGYCLTCPNNYVSNVNATGCVVNEGYYIANVGPENDLSTVVDDVVLRVPRGVRKDFGYAATGTGFNLECNACEGSSTATIAIGITMMAIVAGIAGWWCYKARHESPCSEELDAVKSRFERLMDFVDAIAPVGKILLSYWQIASGLSYVFEIPLPRISKKMMAFFASIVNMDFLEMMPLGCMYKSDFYLTLLMYTISPLIVSACIYRYYKSLKVDEATSGQSSSSQVAGSTRFGFDFSKSYKKKMEYAERQPSSGSRPPLARGETELFLFIQDDLEERESQSRASFSSPRSRSPSVSDRRLSLQQSHSSMSSGRMSESFKVREENTRLRNRIFAAFLVVTFLMLPSVSVKIFSTFSCTHFEGDYGSYLKADFSLDCTTSKHRWYMVYAALMIFIYPLGVPFMYYRLLRGENGNVRERLRCEQEELEHMFGKEEGKKMALVEREQNVKDDESLEKLEFLYKMYEPKAWWFEIFETCRRLMLTGGIIFLNPGTASQIVMSMVICLGAMRVYAGVRPFIDHNDDVLAEAAQWQLFFTMFAALAIKVQLDGETLQDRLYFDVAIIVLQFLAPTVLIMRYYFSEEMQSAEGFWKGLRNVALKEKLELVKTLENSGGAESTKKQELETELDDAKQEAHRAQQELIAARCELDNTKVELASKGDRAKEAEKSLQSVTSEVELTKQEMTKVKQESHRAEQELIAARCDLDNAKTELEIKVKEAETELESFKAKWKTKVREVTKAASENEKNLQLARSEMGLTKRELGSALKELEDARQELGKHQIQQLGKKKTFEDSDSDGSD